MTIGHSASYLFAIRDEQSRPVVQYSGVATCSGQWAVTRQCQCATGALSLLSPENPCRMSELFARRTSSDGSGGQHRTVECTNAVSGVRDDG